MPLRPQTWIFIVLVIANNTPNGSISNFQAIIITSFGFTNKKEALLNMGGGATNLTTGRTSSLDIGSRRIGCSLYS